MATYVISGYATASIVGSAGLATGATFSLDQGFDAATQAITLTVTDNDSYFSGSATSQLDSNQTAVVTDASGATLASGAVRLGAAYSFTAPTGGTARLYQVYVGSTLVGYTATAELDPGVVQTVTATSNTTSSGQRYSSMEEVDYSADAGSSILGGAGNDTIGAGAGNDTVIANAGDDSIDGGDGADSLTAGDGTDTVFGGAGTDTLYGGAGNDWLDGGTGADSLMGDAGDDTFALNDTSGNDTLVGGTQTTADLLDASAMTGAVTLSLTGSGAGSLAGSGATVTIAGVERFVLGAGNDTVTGSTGADWVDAGAGDDSLTGGAGTDTLSGGAGNDTITGGTGSDSLSGGDGDDRFLIASGDGTDTISGGAGVDTLDASGLSTGVTLTISGAGTGAISGSAGSYSFTGVETVAMGAGNDTIYGWSGADTLDGGAGNDNISGNDGADSLIGGAGNDTLSGGSGDDTLVGGAGADYLNGGSGMDYVDYSDNNTAISINLNTWTVSGGWATGDGLAGVDGVIGSAFDDTIIGFDQAAYTGSDIFTNVLSGGAGNDYIDGMASDDVLHGDDDNDTVQGGTGNDSVTGDAGNDSVLGGEGNDVVSGGTGDDVVSGDAGNDTLTGDAGADTLSGGAGADVLSGGEGNDCLTGGSGNDTLSGGAGNDTFGFAAQGGADAITDFDLTLVDGQTLDQIDVSALLDDQGNPVNWNTAVIGTDANGDAVITFAGVTNGPSITLVGIPPEQITKAMLHAMGVPCFTAGTRIATPRGAVPVEALREGDLVLTRDHGAVPVLWAGARTLGRAELAANPDLLPVAIRAGALGDHDDLLLSPQHAVLALTPAGERLVRARHLAELDDPRFRIARGKRQVVYHHFLLPRHAVVLANGLGAESLYPGPMALAALGPVARLEMAAKLPWLAQVVFGLADPARVYGPTARPVAARRGLLLLDPAPGARLRVA